MVGLELDRFIEALAEPPTNLTYPAVTGSRKQSVVDAERLFNPNLIAFMKERRAILLRLKLFGTGEELVTREG